MADQEELDQLAEAEYERLQKQRRQLQNEIQALQEDKNQHSAKEEKKIYLLQQEYDQLTCEANFLELKNHATKESKERANLEYLIFKYNKLQIEFKQEKNSLLELETHIRKIEEEIDVGRNNKVIDNRYKEKIVNVQNCITNAENSLNVLNKKCNNVLTENQKLREFIQHMLQDRVDFNDLWQSTIKKFNEKKKCIMDIIDQSTIAFDQREELCSKLKLLKDKHEADKLIHFQEIRELQRIIEHDAQLQQFYNTKGQKRTNVEVEAKEANKKLQKKKENEKQIDDYNKIILEIQALTSTDKIDNLALQYTIQEEENFALFNYVNELSHEVETLNDIVQILEDKIEGQKQSQAEIEINRQTGTVEYFKNEKAIKTLRLETVETNKNEQVQRLLYLLQQIDYIFRLLRCDDAPILRILDKKSFLTIYNIQIYLGVICKSINSLLKDVSVCRNSSIILAKKDRIPKFNLKNNT